MHERGWIWTSFDEIIARLDLDFAAMDRVFGMAVDKTDNP